MLKEGSINKKLIRTGANCGSGFGLKKNSELINTINYLIQFDKNNNRKKKKLCEELELILRYLQLKQTIEEFNLNILVVLPLEFTYSKFFYNIDEIYIYNT